jgi:hypothetical protein
MITAIVSFAGGLWDVRHDGVYVEDITLHGFTCDPTTPLASRPMYGHGAAYRDGLD